MIWLVALWAKVWKYIVAFGALMLAVAGIYLKGRKEGKATQVAINATVMTKANAQAAQQVTKVQESRNETDAKINALPASPIQAVDIADPATAAGHLRDDGWLSDEDNSPH